MTVISQSGIGVIIKENNNYVAGLDFLRSLAIVAVVAYHLDLPKIRGGLIGVDLFMVISGFLVTRSLMGFKFSFGIIREFYVKRIKRLFPALIALLVIVLILIGTLPEVSRREQYLDAASSLFFIANWRFIATSADYFQSVNNASLVQHLWSLSIEEQFYIFWPLIILLVPKKRRRFFCGGLVVAAALQMSVRALYADPSRLYFGTDTRSQALLIGAFVALCATESSIERLPNLRKWTTITFSMAVFITVVLLTSLDPSSRHMYLYGYFSVAVLSAIAIACLSIANVYQQRFLQWLEHPILSSLGKRSYSLYLFHWPVVVMINKDKLAWPPLMIMTVRLLVMMALTQGSYYLIENRFRKSGGNRRAVRVLLATNLTLGAILVFAAIFSSSIPSYLRGGTQISGNKFSSDANLNVRVIGDSLVESLKPGLIEAATKKGVRIEIISISGCGLLPGLVTSQNGVIYEPSRVCSEKVSRELNHLFDKPKVDVTVWLNAWDTEMRLIGDEKIDPTVDFVKLKELYYETSTVLLRNSKTVVIVTNPVRAMSSILNPEGPDDAVVKRQNSAKNVILSLIGRDPRIRIANLADYVCGVRCNDLTHTGQRFRPTDGIHFESGGAEVAANWLLDEVRDTYPSQKLSP
jgi:peptidoglycan/LPS O-acetylase OafA/YrhL